MNKEEHRTIDRMATMYSELITAKRQLLKSNLQLQRRGEQLARANEDLESFSRALSHDLKTSVGIISGYTELLADACRDKLSPEEEALVPPLLNAARNINVTIEALQRLVRLGQQDLIPKDVDLSVLAREVLQTVLPQYAHQTYRVTVQEGLRVQGDRDLLWLVLQNLLENACKFSARVEQPTIELGRELAADGVWFFVRDNGLGFDMQRQDELFRPFRRLHAGLDLSGSGLGLATVKRILERHGGTIRAVGEPGHGATFYFRLA